MDAVRCVILSDQGRMAQAFRPYWMSRAQWQHRRTADTMRLRLGASKAAGGGSFLGNRR
jgi:hypothetical protein